MTPENGRGGEGGAGSAPPEGSRRPPRSILLEIEYHTDPLCCWSEAFEPHWRRLLREHGERVAWRYRMGGMLPDWRTFDDPINSISRPAQMGPLWMQARHVSGVPMDDRLWLEDPPFSSYPPCVAFKAAEGQSLLAGERYLERLRRAAFRERRNIARAEVLLEVARELADDEPGVLDADAFAADIDSPPVLEAFAEDLRLARRRGIGRFPALAVRPPGGPGVILVGYRPYAALLGALREVAPDIEQGDCPDRAGAITFDLSDRSEKQGA